eukprot:g5215.t1
MAELTKLEEYNKELLLCARYGELPELKQLIEAGATIDFQDPYGGSTALHYAAANGHLDVAKILVENGAKVLKNLSGNSALHWAAQNKHREVFEFLCSDACSNVDVLEKNDEGKSALTCAFASGDVEMAKLALAHKSAAKLEDAKDTKGVENEDGTVSFSAGSNNDAPKKSKDAVHLEGSLVHDIQFSCKAKKKTKRGPLLRVRELPITDQTEDIFKTEATDDKTGLGLWPASVVLSHWLVELRFRLKGQSIAELGSGCGLAGLVAARYTKAKHVVLTDRFDTTVENLKWNVEENCNQGRGAETEVLSVDWADEEAWGQRWGQKGVLDGQQFDSIIGADLVYHADVLPIFLATLRRTLKVGGSFYYVTQANRDGVVELLKEARKAGLVLIDCREAPTRFRRNPLKGRSDLECDMLLSGLLPDSGTTIDHQTGEAGSNANGRNAVSFKLIEFRRDSLNEIELVEGK